MSTETIETHTSRSPNQASKPDCRNIIGFRIFDLPNVQAEKVLSAFQKIFGLFNEFVYPGEFSVQYNWPEIFVTIFYASAADRQIGVCLALVACTTRDAFRRAGSIILRGGLR